MGVSGRVQEFMLDPVIFNFENNDGSDSDFYKRYRSVKFCTEVMTEE